MIQHMRLAAVLGICFYSYFAVAVSNPDMLLDTLQLITKYGYHGEAHTVTTSDGYILTMHRIAGSEQSPPASGKPVVFLQHGLMCSSADWIILGPEKSLGYLLADAGYDVWMGNARGNTYSKDHITYSTTSQVYWDFSWHEMGIFDLPAEFDYVLEQTGQEDLYYVGHSMGTTMFYVLMSVKPEYSTKVRHMISLAPIAYMKNCRSALATFGSYFPGGQLGMAALQLLGVGELMPNNGFMKILSDLACTEGSIFQPMCQNILFLIVGYDSSQLNKTVLPVILAHTPAGASTKSLSHYAQEISAIEGGFRQWDFYLGNWMQYGSIFPPEYQLSHDIVPTTLFYGDNDLFGDPTDVHQLNTALGKSLEEYRVPLSSFAHMDFLWANDVKTLVNDKVLEVIQSN
ncbi:lipase 3-like [Periplaneta americana]|uniref:lipase 3-like n=1 Tax=Periplaneta americana TaxID=6978 RepID=UPI0037E8646D